MWDWTMLHVRIWRFSGVSHGSCLWVISAQNCRQIGSRPGNVLFVCSPHGSHLDDVLTPHLGGGGGVGRISATASHRNWHIWGNLENKKALTRMGRDSHRGNLCKHETYLCLQPWGRGMANGGNMHGLPSNSPGCIRKTILLSMQKSSGFPLLMRIFSLHLLFYPGRQKFFLSGSLFPQQKLLGAKPLADAALPEGPLPTSCAFLSASSTQELSQCASLASVSSFPPGLVSGTWERA